MAAANMSVGGICNVIQKRLLALKTDSEKALTDIQGTLEATGS